ncbi:VOC family protein [Aidingimonas lacisalsi]|uniref:VOC family protein n=1 Tax=Aidingimonas lacisalsi TaxID=2604086 RepID=UPI0011D1806C|nr:VOC family protein [Aidingimonas lacisalsi]
MSSLERLIPVLVYRDIAVAHDFLVQAFGFKAGGVERDADGKAVHAEVRVGGTPVWLHRVTTEHQLGSPETVDMAGAGLVVYVSDVDTHFANARAAGARIQYEPTDQLYGQREYEARDLEGHRWWFATPLSTSTPS